MPTRKLKRALAAALAALVCAGVAWAAPGRRAPHIGYVFPAGGRRGATFEVFVGGQYLRDVDKALVSGAGVRATVTQHYRSRRINTPETRAAVLRMLVELRNRRLAELPPSVKPPPLPGERLLRYWEKKNKEKAKALKKLDPAEAGNKHPLLRGIEKASLRRLYAIATKLFDYRARKKQQLNTQLRETVVVEVEIDRDAAPGPRELRLQGRRGLTNPMVFEVGALPETREEEPNGPGQLKEFPRRAPPETPFVMNGQVMPGDVDRFAFRAKRGQRLVIETRARRLVPFLADAVPGWFQATVALYDARGRELAFADDYRFHPDPVLFFEVPEDGVYELEIRDAIYRGRQDFVYRVGVSEAPFVTHLFPLGGREGERTVASVKGWNLPDDKVSLPTSPGPAIRRTTLRGALGPSNVLTYAVDKLPEIVESEPNDDRKAARAITLPVIVNGRVDRPGDVDVYRFEGRGGDEIVAEVHARRLGSPLDSLARLMDASGRVIAWNDDVKRVDPGFLHPDMGLQTDHADSYLRARLPKSGAYYVSVADTRNHGSQAHAYRLRVGPPRPDFELLVTPSSLPMRASTLEPLAVYALRKDGFAGAVDLKLKDAPRGFVLSGARIPEGCSSIRITLTPPRRPVKKPFAIRLIGSAEIDGATVTRAAHPAEDAMQAFLYRHLAPSEELVAAVGRGWGFGHTVKRVGDGPVRVPLGGAGQVTFKSRWLRGDEKVELELKAPPPGLAVGDVRVTRGRLDFALKAEGPNAKPGLANNAIIEVFIEREHKPKDKPPQKRRVSMGLLPAVPFAVYER